MKRKRIAIHFSEIKEQPLCFRRKQLEPQLYRWRRLHISPVVFPGDDSHFPTVREVSCDFVFGSMSILIPPEKLHRTMARSYDRQNFNKACKNNDEAVELWDVSCVQSRMGTMILKSSEVEEVDVEGGKITKSEVSGTSRFSFPAIGGKRSQSCVGTTPSEVDLEISGVNEISFEEITNYDVDEDYSDENGDVPLNSRNRAASKVGGIEAASGEISFPDLFHLPCSEQFSNGSVTNYGAEADDDEEELNSSSSAIFNLASKPQLESSDYTPSSWSCASETQVSEESSSPTFELFGKFKQQFCRSTCSLADCDDHCSAEINKLELEDEEDEESFRMIRRRERSWQEYVHDFAEEDCNYTAYRDLVIQQRLQMVHCIVKEPTKRELQQKTMFLGVDQELDRFMRKGYLQNPRNLQISGIDCLSLATGIEENQPYNCIATLNEHRFYLKAAKANEKMGHQQLCFWLSTVAAELVSIASNVTNQDPSCPLVTEIVSLAKEPFRPSQWPSSQFKLTDAAAKRTIQEHEQLKALQDIYRARERLGLENAKAQLRAKLIEIGYEGGFTFTVQWMKRPNAPGFDFFIHGVFEGHKKKTGRCVPLTLRTIDEKVGFEIQAILHRIMPTKFERRPGETIKVANKRFWIYEYNTHGLPLGMHPQVYFQIIIHLHKQIRPFLDRLAADLRDQEQTFMVGDLICRVHSYLGFYAHVSGTKHPRISSTVMLFELKMSVDDYLYFVDYRGNYMGHLIESATNNIKFLPDGM